MFVKFIMNDEKIYKITTITSIVALVAIILLSGYVTPEKLTIEKVDKSKTDNTIEVEATVTKITTTRTGTQIIELEDKTGKINMVIFPSARQDSEIHEDTRISVTAKVTQYNGQPELLLEEANNLRIT